MRPDKRPPSTPRDESPVGVIISARIEAFEPAPGEPADGYRARVEPMLRDRFVADVAQVSFENFVSRVRDAIGRAFPDARATVVTPEPAMAVEPGGNKRAQRPEDPAYDPHEAHYPNPMYGMFGMTMLGMAFMPSFGADASSADSRDAGGSDGSDAGDDGGLFDFEW